MQLPFGVSITFGNGNGKNGNGYMKKVDCLQKHAEMTAHIDTKLQELTIDRNQRLIELKADLQNYFDIKIQMIRDLMGK